MSFGSLLESVLAGEKVALMTSGLGLTGLVIYSFSTHEKIIYLPLALMAIAFCSSFAGGIRGGMSVRTAGWKHGVVVSTAYLIFAFLIKLALFNKAAISITSVPILAGILFLGALGGIIGVNLRYVHQQRIRKRRVLGM